MDMQSGLAPAMPASAWGRARECTNVLLRAASILEVPVILTRHYPEGLGEADPNVAESIPNYAIDIKKTRFSACGTSEFDAELSSSGRTQIVVCGMETHICVLQTVSDLASSGYCPFVVSEAVCSRNQEHREQALDQMRNTDIRVTNSESVIFEWLRDSRDEAFRSLLALIK
jgi:nicotinamidase-related amidase